MIGADDARRVAEVAGRGLAGVSRDPASFARLPDTFWGYYARGHDSKGAFGVILTYSEDAGDVDSLIAMYEEWLKRSKATSSR